MFEFIANSIAKRFSKKVSKRSYDGAKSGRLIDFFAGTRSADDEIRFDIRKLRDRCREMIRNDPYSKRYVAIMKTNIVGEKGILLQPNALEDDGRSDEAANNLILQAWHKWAKKGFCTIDERLSFVDCQDLLIEQLSSEGEALIQLVTTNKNPFGFALKFLDTDQLDEELNKNLENGKRIKMGVELDKNDKPLAYWLFEENPNENFMLSRAARMHRRVPADQILHIYRQTRPGQTRGVPPLAAALLRVRQLNGYIDAELTAARIGASKMGFFTSSKGEDYQGEDKEDVYNPIMNAEPGTFEQLPEGMAFQTFDPQHPTSQFQDFVKQILRSFASSLNISYATLSNDLESVNYSSIRQGALEERFYFKKEQNFLIEHFLQPVFERWLLMAMTTGALNLPMRKFEKFANPKWMPRGFGYIDPLKETQSYSVALNNGTMTLNDIASIHGRDVKSLLEQIKKEKELAQSLGIDLAFEPFGAKGALQKSEDKEDE